MQCGVSELDDAVRCFLMASAGTCAQMGSAQCMQTCGAVWTLSRRSTVSRWMTIGAMRVAFCARVDARHNPMHRE
jgi:hypothetical protein